MASSEARPRSRAAGIDCECPLYEMMKELLADV